jgi:hypothetical protein
MAKISASSPTQAGCKLIGGTLVGQQPRQQQQQQGGAQLGLLAAQGPCPQGKALEARSAMWSRQGGRPMSPRAPLMTR